MLKKEKILCIIISFCSIFAPIIGAGMIYLPFELGVAVPAVLGILTPTVLWLIFKKNYPFLNYYGRKNTNWIVTNLIIYSTCIFMINFDFIVFTVIFGIILVFGSLINLFVGFASLEDLIRENKSILNRSEKLTIQIFSYPFLK